MRYAASLQGGGAPAGAAAALSPFERERAGAQVAAALGALRSSSHIEEWEAAQECRAECGATAPGDAAEAGDEELQAEKRLSDELMGELSPPPGDDALLVTAQANAWAPRLLSALGAGAPRAADGAPELPAAVASLFPSATEVAARLPDGGVRARQRTLSLLRRACHGAALPPARPSVRVLEVALARCCLTGGVLTFYFAARPPAEEAARADAFAEALGARLCHHVHVFVEDSLTAMLAARARGGAAS